MSCHVHILVIELMKLEVALDSLQCIVDLASVIRICSPPFSIISYMFL